MVGYKKTTEDGENRYYGEYLPSSDGFIFKDKEAFKSGVGVCYVPEHDFDGSPTDEYGEAYVTDGYGYTREDIINEVRATIEDKTDIRDEAFVEEFATHAFSTLSWQYLETYLLEAVDENIEEDFEYFLKSKK